MHTLPAGTTSHVVATLGLGLLLCLAPAGEARSQTFDDVPANYWAYPFIELLSASGVTSGCGGGNYCPAQSVTRAQMAVFLERGFRGSDFVPPPATGSVFGDVAAQDFAAAWIEQLAADGITGGCGGGNFCPTGSVTRAQMAVFLLRAVYGAGFTPPPASGVFPDVPVNYWAAAWIEQLAADGITSGCGGGNFCPENAVSRDQMAVFLVRAFDLTGRNLNLQGTATDMPLAGAGISANVWLNASNNQAFAATADAFGNYSVDVASGNPAFVTLTADGIGDQQEARLRSLAGSIGTLGNAANAGVVTSAGIGALNITHVSTALAVLAERENGGPIRSDAELAAAQARVSGAELLTMAAVIKSVIDNVAVTLPPGIANTLELVSEPTGYEAFLADLQNNFPTQYAAAITQTADSLALGYAEADVPGVLFANQVDGLPLQGGAFAFEFDADQTGAVVLFNGISDTTWSIDGAGSLVVTLLTPPVTESFPFRDPPGGQVRALIYFDRITLTRIADGPAGDQVIVLVRRVTEFPDNPELMPEVVDDEIGPGQVYLAFGVDGLVPFDTAGIAGTQIGTEYFNQANDAIGTTDPNLGADLLSFQPGGTGITQRRQFLFTWFVDAEGGLVVAFPNGDTTRYLRHAGDGPVSLGVAVSSDSSGAAQVSSVDLVSADGSAFDTATLEDRRYRALFSVLDGSLFDYLFLSNGEGCRISFAPPGSNNPWSVIGPGLMDSFLFSNFDPTTPRQRRSWQPVAIEPGILGDRYWLIENADFNNFQPGFEFADPLVTPGRINAYEFVEDLTGQANPCGF